MTDQQAISPHDLVIWGNKFRSQSKRAARAIWKFIDFLADGYRAYGDAIYDQMDEKYYALGTLRNFVTTGLNFPLSRRVNLPQLSPSHFQAVNSIKDPEYQAIMLRWAADKGVGRDALREECKRLRLLPPGDKTALELALDNHALMAENTIAARELAATKAEVAAANGRYHALEEQVAEMEARAADYAPPAMTYPRGEDHSEWAQSPAVCPACGGVLVCRECGEVQS